MSIWSGRWTFNARFCAPASRARNVQQKQRNPARSLHPGGSCVGPSAPCRRRRGTSCLARVRAKCRANILVAATKATWRSGPLTKNPLRAHTRACAYCCQNSYASGILTDGHRDLHEPTTVHCHSYSRLYSPPPERCAYGISKKGPDHRAANPASFSPGSPMIGSIATSARHKGARLLPDQTTVARPSGWGR